MIPFNGEDVDESWFILMGDGSLLVHRASVTAGKDANHTLHQSFLTGDARR